MPTNDNIIILERIRGVAAQPGTPETDADPRNPKAPPRPVEITDSCGCVFCDLDDMPEMIHGVLKHHYFGHDGRLVICTRVD